MTSICIWRLQMPTFLWMENVVANQTSLIYQGVSFLSILFFSFCSFFLSSDIQSCLLCLPVVCILILKHVFLWNFLTRKLTLFGKLLSHGNTESTLMSPLCQILWSPSFGWFVWISRIITSFTHVSNIKLRKVWRD